MERLMCHSLKCLGLKTSEFSRKRFRMVMKNLLEAAKKALEIDDNRGIKRILRRSLHVPCIFTSVTNHLFGLPARKLFLRANIALPNSEYDDESYDDFLGNILLRLAVQQLDCELIRLLVEIDADVASRNRAGRTALHIACCHKSLDVIKLLIEHSPARILEITDCDGVTPLVEACQWSTPEVVRILLLQGSSVVVQDVRRRGPLLNAVDNKAEYATPIASQLLDASANINHADDSGVTALIAAVKRSAKEMSHRGHSVTSQKYSYVDLCMLLIDRGCDVNAANYMGQTALHIAVKTKQEILVRKLLISGSDMVRPDIKSLTPIYYACRCGNQRIVNLLITSGANLYAQDWETVFERWRRSEKLNEKNAQLLNYVIYASKQCLSLENLCISTLRKNVRNVEKDTTQIGLPPHLLKRLQLKD